ncbi:unnamed protein product [Vicia faba]|uniref:Uncharacterized protein n=1 Tax=Vicia faba TaxID=3906 RepID=A0AAV1B6D2_VICFA|nr:unnamed protein product [Vicia faba]
MLSKVLKPHVDQFGEGNDDDINDDDDEGLRNTNNVGSQDMDYDNEELESSYPDDSGNEKKHKTKYEKFREELLNKEFQFKLGVKFNSLYELKDAISECDVFMEKLSESFSSIILQDRGKLIPTVYEWIRNYLTNKSNELDPNTLKIKKKTPRKKASSSVAKVVSKINAIEGVSEENATQCVFEVDVMIKKMMEAFEDELSQDPHSQVCNPTPIVEQAEKTQEDVEKNKKLKKNKHV